MQKEIGNLEIVQCVNSDIIDSMKNNGTKYLLNLAIHSKRFAIWKNFVDITTTGRHRRLGVVYIKHNLYLQSKLGRDLELQNTQLVFVKSLCDWMNFSTLSKQLGLGSELLDWYWDTVFVLSDNLLIDLWPRTDEWLRYCTNTGPNPSKYCIPERFKHVRSLNKKKRETSLFSVCSNCFPTDAKSFSFSLAQKLYQVSLQAHSK